MYRARLQHGGIWKMSRQLSHKVLTRSLYTMVKKNTGDSSHQALTNFSFSELFCNRFSLK